jgi:DNA repair exonuclease SbcCD ATPase subunit
MRVVSLSLFVVALSRTNGPTDSPIARVVVLINGLKSKIMADGQAEQAVYDKYACWCEKTTGRKASAIEKAKTDIESLSQEIKELKGRLGSFVAEVAGLEKNIADLQSSITKMEKMRKNENEEYLADKASLEQGIANLEKAIQVLSAGTSGFSPAMMETRMLTVAAGVRNALHLYASHNTGSDIKSHTDDFATVKSFLGTPSAWVEESASVYSPHKGTYSTQSGAVQGILADMLDTFKRNRESAIEEETMKAAEYSNLMDTKLKDLSLLKKTLTKKKMDQGDDTKALGEAKLNRADTQKQLDTDEEFFGTTQTACKAKADEWSERSRLRAEELAGINEAVAILTDPSSQDIFTEAGTFLQTSAEKDRSAAAYKVLQETARATGSPKIAAVATKAKMTAKGHFDRIIANIDKMMANLRTEEKDDIEKKTWCENEMTSANNRNEALEADKDSLTSKINRGKSKVSQLNAAIEEAEASINEEEETMANATDVRNSDNRAYKAAVKADTDAVMLVTKAIEALSKFYSLRQDHVNHHHTHGGDAHVKHTHGARKDDPEYTTSEDTPPETFEGTYGGRGSENSGIVGILSMIKEDLQKDIAKAHEEEAESVAEYRKLVAESKENVAALNKKINAMKTQIADTELEIEEDETEWTEKDTQKKKTDAYIAEIKPNCDWIKDNFKPRQEARKTEMDGLDTAKGQLAGMQEMAAIATNNQVATATAAATPAWKAPTVDDELKELDVTAQSFGVSFLQCKA